MEGDMVHAKMTSQSVANPQRMMDIALTGRVLGALFYCEPQGDQLTGLLATLQDGQWYRQWPVDHPALAAIARQMSEGIGHERESLTVAYQRLFIGPWALPAPPWGSVWLDRENVLFGDSMLALRQWMRGHGIDQQMSQNEPDDHIGRLLMLAAWLADEERESALDELLAWHLLPWAERFLDVLIEQADHPFYGGLGQLTRITLSGWRQALLIPVADKELYR